MLFLTVSCSPCSPYLNFLAGDDVLQCKPICFLFRTLSEAIGSLSRRRNSSDGSVLIRRLTEV